MQDAPQGGDGLTPFPASSGERSRAEQGVEDAYLAVRANLISGAADVGLSAAQREWDHPIPWRNPEPDLTWDLPGAPREVPCIFG
eukprot:gene14473-biopygen1923